MVVLSALKSILCPVKTEISRMTLKTQTLLTTPISLKTSSSNKFTTRVTSLNNFVSDEILVKVKQNNPFEEGVQRMKELMGRKLREDCHVEELVIIDAINRLGLEYYFQDEIHNALRKHYQMFDTKERGHDDLHYTALCFRLLRQQGYNVPSGTFGIFKDGDGKLKQELGKDIKGLLSLFEASHLRVPGDDILDQASEFSMRLLTNLKNIEPWETCIVQNTLDHPYHKSLPRFTALDFLQKFQPSMKLLHDCGSENNWMADVTNLARIDINQCQMTVKHEINEFRRWWDELRLPEELKLAGNQIVKWHMWSLACLPAPNISELRVELTKTISFVYIMDDIFDTYGTLEELTLLTNNVNKWEYETSDSLPEYMIICFKALFDTTREISHKIYLMHGLDPTIYIQKVWAEYLKASLVQAKWFASGYIPTTEEYMKNEIGTTGSFVVHIHIYLLLGEILNNTTDIISGSHPSISSLAATILRLWDDLGSSKDEGQNHDGSVIDCYMNEHEGSSSESAREYVSGMISDAWSLLNEILISSSSSLSSDYKVTMANFARIIPIMYSYDENHHLPDLNRLIKPLLNET